MNCDHTGCTNDAAGSIALNIPAVGCPLKEHDPIRLVLGLKLCTVHGAGAKASDFMSEQLKQIVCIAAKGRAAPDFDRAFLTPVSFDSAEWKMLNKPQNPK